MRVRAAVIALLAAGVTLSACDDAAEVAACRVDVDTPELIADREAAGIDDCDTDAWAAGDGAGADLPDIDLHCLGSDRMVSLADVHGPAVINVWASNCGPCREEMPVLQEFAELYGDQVTVVGLDFLDTYPGAAIDLARRTGATYPSIADACGDLQETDLVLRVLPQFLFVAADGTVTQRPGGVDTLEEIVELTEAGTGVDLTEPKRQGGAA